MRERITTILFWTAVTVITAVGVWFLALFLWLGDAFLGIFGGALVH